MKKNLYKHKFDKYQVWWEDALSHNEWKDIEEAKKDAPAICLTEGYLLTKNNKWTTFFMSITGDEIGEQMIIPTKNIKKMKKIGSIEIQEKDFKYDNY
jgi:hypothetical protein